jgi:hypothetical protein
MYQDGLFKNSHYCNGWYDANFNEENCRAFSENLLLKDQMKEWEKLDTGSIGPYGTPHNEVVFIAPNGIDIKYIKYVVVQDKEYRIELSKKYPHIDFRRELEME